MKGESKTKTHFRPREAARHILEKVPTAYLNDTVKKTQDKIIDRKAMWDTVSYVYILDKHHKLKGVISIKELFRARRNIRMNKFLGKKVAVVYPHSPIQVAASRALSHNLKQVPVVGRNGKFMGVVGNDDIIDTLEHEHVRDLLSMTGLRTGEDASFKNVLSARVSQLIKWRTPWLMLGLIGGIITVSIVDGFQEDLKQAIELAFFIPVVLYMGAAIGNQTQMLYVRGIAYQKINVRQYLIREFLSDLVIGMVLGFGVGAFGVIITESFQIGLILFTSISLIGSTAGLIAVIISTIFKKLKQDPAIGGGPFDSVVQDITSILIYFAVASAFLN